MAAVAGGVVADAVEADAGGEGAVGAVAIGCYCVVAHGLSVVEMWGGGCCGCDG